MTDIIIIIIQNVVLNIFDVGIRTLIPAATIPPVVPIYLSNHAVLTLLFQMMK